MRTLNDLERFIIDLDHFCLTIARELHEITAVSPIDDLYASSYEIDVAFLFSTRLLIQMNSCTRIGISLSLPLTDAEPEP